MEKYLCELGDYINVGDTLEEAFDKLDTDGEIPNLDECSFYKLIPVKVKLVEYE